jgi:cytochrome b561
MGLSSPTQASGYTGTAIALHWLIAVALAGSFALGLYMHDLPLSPQKLKLYSWHKWAGVTIFLFVTLRLAWRLGHRPPTLPTAMPAWQRQAAAATHVLLYVLMFAVPLSGWLMSSAKGFQTVWFGVLPLPDLLNKDKELGDLLQQIHMLLNLRHGRTGGGSSWCRVQASLPRPRRRTDAHAALPRQTPLRSIPMNRTPRPIALLALLLVAPAAQAIEFNQFQPAKSSLSFVSKQMNVPVDGRFTSFRAKLAFDPAKPAAARAELEIDLASIDAGSKDANDEVATKAWFNTREFPLARFVATTVKPLGGNRYEARRQDEHQGQDPRPRHPAHGDAGGKQCRL